MDRLRARFYSDIQNKKGYTVVELLVVLAVVGLVITTVGQFFITQLHTFNRESERLVLQEQGVEATKICGRIFSAAQKIDSVTLDAAGHLTFMTVTRQVDKSHTVQTTLQLSEGKLLIRWDAGDTGAEARQVADHIDSITARALTATGSELTDVSEFTKAGVMGLHLTFELKEGAETLNQDMTMYFRNAL